MASAEPAAQIKTLYSVQASYTVYEVGNAATCDDVINIPLCHTLFRQTVIDKGSYNIMPVVEIVPMLPLRFTLITNEGVTLEPLDVSSCYPNNPYANVPYYFVLPRGTTGIKHVIVDSKYNLRAALEFGIMPPPYNYDNALHGPTAYKVIENEEHIKENEGSINELTQEVSHLKNEGIYATLNLAKYVGNYLNIPGVEAKSRMLGWYLELNTGSTLKVEFKVGTTSEIVIDETDISSYNLVFLAFDRLSGVISLYGGHYSGATSNATSQKLLSSGVVMPWDASAGEIIITKDGLVSESNIRKGFVTLAYKG